MKVPDRVRYLFDLFPLYRLPLPDLPEIQCNSFTENGMILGVYSLDSDGFPVDPRCLELYSFLLLHNIRPTLQIMSPYATSNETLPILWTSKEVAHKFTSRAGPFQVVSQWPQLFPEEYTSDLKIFKTLLETWIEDAWHETIMSTEYTALRERIYGESHATHLPWIFSRLSEMQLDEHLDTRHASYKQGKGDDYKYTPRNTDRVAMTLDALSSTIESQSEEGRPSILDIMVFSYIWPITQCIDDSALGQLIPTKLRQHADQLREHLVDLQRMLVNTNK